MTRQKLDSLRSLITRRDTLARMKAIFLALLGLVALLALNALVS